MFDIDELLDAAIKLHAEYHMGKEGLSDTTSSLPSRNLYKL